VDNVLLYGADHDSSTFSILLKKWLEILVDGEHGCLVASSQACLGLVVENKAFLFGLVQKFVCSALYVLSIVYISSL